MPGLQGMPGLQTRGSTESKSGGRFKSKKRRR